MSLISPVLICWKICSHYLAFCCIHRGLMSRKRSFLNIPRSTSWETTTVSPTVVLVSPNVVLHLNFTPIGLANVWCKKCSCKYILYMIIWLYIITICFIKFVCCILLQTVVFFYKKKTLRRKPTPPGRHRIIHHHIGPQAVWPHGHVQEVHCQVPSLSHGVDASTENKGLGGW